MIKSYFTSGCVFIFWIWMECFGLCDSRMKSLFSMLLRMILAVTKSSVDFLNNRYIFKYHCLTRTGAQ